MWKIHCRSKADRLRRSGDEKGFSSREQMKDDVTQPKLPNVNRSDDSHAKSMNQEILRQQIDVRVTLWHVSETWHPALCLFLQMPTVDDTGAGFRNTLAQRSRV
jgi:hypothetical protein